MASSILSVGQSALAAAQIGLTTTAHNIANANTPGYTRQIVVQGSAGAQDDGFGFVGKGTQVAEVRRVYNEFLSNRVNSSQSSANELSTYYTQISQINNAFADQTSGLAPALQDFFDGIQKMAANPQDISARQTALSSAESMAGRLQSLDGQLKEMYQGINGQITSSINTINTYAAQIAKINDEIEKAQGVQDGKPSNDLLDQRDYLVNQLSQEVKTTVVKQGASYSIFIGNGQPLVVGTKTFNLSPTRSDSDTGRITVGYSSNGQVVALDESSLPGGTLGGLLSFRSKTLDTVQNSLGQIAVGLAASFNNQNALGQDLSGAMGGAVFNVGAPETSAARNNTGSDVVGATITNAGALTTSDYKLQRDASGTYKLTRLSDNQSLYEGGSFPSGEFDGLTFSSDSSGFPNGNEYVIRPTAAAASGFSVAITDPAKLAAAAPIATAAATGNIGNGKISAGSVVGPAPVNANLQQPVTITFTSATTYTLTGTGMPAGDQTYTPPKQTISFNGWSVDLTGQPAANDSFSIGPNTGGVRDNRNALALSALQTAGTLSTGTASLSFQEAYSQIVSAVGNKTNELQITSKAEASSLANAYAAQQSESGVNLDEEATNLLRYQQAYQAAGKVMQTASQLFELLLSLGGT